MTEAICSAHADGTAQPDVVGKLIEQLGVGPFRTIVFFAHHTFDPGVLETRLHEAYAEAAILGCSASGEISDRCSGTGGMTAMALSDAVVGRCSVALARYEDGDVGAGVDRALRCIEQDLDVRLRDLDPAHWVGLVLIEGSSGSEERVNAALGNAAPFLSFVGGSASSESPTNSTWCVAQGQSTQKGCALVVFEMRRPFTVLKTCNFVPTDNVLIPTKVDGRLVHEFNGRPATAAYAAALGLSPTQLSPQVFFGSPVGMIIDGEPWLRSPRGIGPSGSEISFFCEIPEGAELRVMKSTGNLVGSSARAFEEASRRMGRPIRGALLFNCIYRRLEMDALQLHQDFVDILRFPASGFHTRGESWLGHMNQTLTALVIG